MMHLAKIVAGGAMTHQERRHRPMAQGGNLVVHEAGGSIHLANIVSSDTKKSCNPATGLEDE